MVHSEDIKKLFTLIPVKKPQKENLFLDLPWQIYCHYVPILATDTIWKKKKKKTLRFQHNT